MKIHEDILTPYVPCISHLRVKIITVLHQQNYYFSNSHYYKRQSWCSLAEIPEQASQTNLEIKLQVWYSFIILTYWREHGERK